MPFRLWRVLSGVARPRSDVQIPCAAAWVVLPPAAMGAKTFEELRAWQYAAQLSDRIVALCVHTPALRHGRFRDQMVDAAEAAPRLIAEGFGRWSHREFARYLTMAQSEVMELRSDLLALQRRQTIEAELAADLLDLAEQVAKTIAKLRSSL